MKAEHLDWRFMCAPSRALEKVQLLGQSVVNPAELVAISNGPIHRECADSKHALEFVKEGDRIFGGTIALIDKGKNRDATAAANLEEFARLRLDTFSGVDDHDRGINRGEHAVGVLGEILVAWRVKQVHAIAVVVKLQHRRRDGDTALLLQFHPVGGSRALILARGDTPGQRDRAAIEEKLLSESRLSGVRVRDDREGSAGEVFGRHSGDPPKRTLIVAWKRHPRSMSVARDLA